MIHADILVLSYFFSEPSSGVCATQIPNKIFRYMHTKLVFFLLHSMARIAQPQRFYQILLCLHIVMFRLKQATFFCWLLRPTFDETFTISPRLYIYVFLWSCPAPNRSCPCRYVAIANSDVWLHLGRACRYDFSVASKDDFRSPPIPIYEFAAVAHCSARALVTIRSRVLCIAVMVRPWKAGNYLRNR